MDLLLLFRHRLLVLLKCILLEKRILTVHSPVHSLSSSILALVSLLPRTLEAGLTEATDIPSGDYATLAPVRTKSRPANESSNGTEGPKTPRLDLELLDEVDLDEAGFPFPIFGCGNLCHPYLALPYIDLLSSENVRGFLVGATNMLFKQKRNLSDVIVQVSSTVTASPHVGMLPSFFFRNPFHLAKRGVSSDLDNTLEVGTEYISSK